MITLSYWQIITYLMIAGITGSMIGWVFLAKHYEEKAFKNFSIGYKAGFEVGKEWHKDPKKVLGKIFTIKP